MNATRLLVVSTSFASLLMMTCTARGELIAADGFDVTDPNGYVPHLVLHGQQSDFATGFSGPWEDRFGNLFADPEGLSFPSVGYESGGSVTSQVRPPEDFFRAASRSIDSVPASSKYYMSHLIEVEQSLSSSRDEAYAIVGFGSPVSELNLSGIPFPEPLQGAFVGFTTHEDGTDLFLRSLTGDSLVTDHVMRANIAFDTTYLVVMRLDTEPSSVTYWVNPMDVRSEAAMSGSSLATGTIPGMQLVEFSNLTRLATAKRNMSRRFVWDESRLATDLASLMGIPEPGGRTLVVMAAAALAICVSGRRGQKHSQNRFLWIGTAQKVGLNSGY